MDTRSLSPQYLPGANVISIVDHHTTVHSGDPVKIVKPWIGTLCAVLLPDGMIHRWFASFELSPINGELTPGSPAVVTSSTGHGQPPHVESGTTVRIVKCMPRTIFYDVTLSNGEYHRWLAEFELARPI